MPNKTKEASNVADYLKKNNKWVPKVVLIDFARHMWRKWVLHN